MSESQAVLKGLIERHGIVEVLDAIALNTYLGAIIWPESGEASKVRNAWLILHDNINAATSQFKEGF